MKHTYVCLFVCALITCMHAWFIVVKVNMRLMITQRLDRATHDCDNTEIPQQYLYTADIIV